MKCRYQGLQRCSNILLLLAIFVFAVVSYFLFLENTFALEILINFLPVAIHTLPDLLAEFFLGLVEL